MIAAHKCTRAKAKIFIVDDHSTLRHGLTQLIDQEDDMISVGEACNATEAIAGIKKEKPDLVTMDISLAGLNGIKLTEIILDKQPKMLVLMVSMHDEAIYVERILQIGARGYLQKRDLADHIIIAIRSILGGEIYVSNKWEDKPIYKTACLNTKNKKTRKSPRPKPCPPL